MLREAELNFLAIVYCVDYIGIQIGQTGLLHNINKRF